MSYKLKWASQVVLPGVREPQTRTWALKKKREAGAVEVEECREQPGEEVNGRRSGNSGGEVGPLGFYYADCPTRLISQCTLQRPATEFEIDSHLLLIIRVLTLAVRLFPPFI